MTNSSTEERERPVEGRSPSDSERGSLGALGVIAALARRVAGRPRLMYDFLKDTDANRLLVVVVAIVLGVGGVLALFWAMDRTVDLLPQRFREGVRPYVYIGPAIVILSSS